MEDTYCHADKIAGDSSCGFFAIFDGHGGKHVAEHCAESFPIEIKKELRKQHGDLIQVLDRIYKKVDDQLLMMDSDHCGSTACVAVVRKENDQNILYVANTGDTRAVLSKNG